VLINSYFDAFGEGGVIDVNGKGYWVTGVNLDIDISNGAKSGNLVVYTNYEDKRYKLTIKNLNTGEKTIISETEEMINGVWISPSGKKIIYTKDLTCSQVLYGRFSKEERRKYPKLWIYDIESTAINQLTDDGCFACNWRGNTLFFIKNNGTSYGFYVAKIDEVNMSVSEPIKIYTIRSWPKSAQLSLDGKTVFFSDYCDNGMAIVSIDVDGNNKKIIATGLDGRRSHFVVLSNTDGSTMLVYEQAKVENTGTCQTRRYNFIDINGNLIKTVAVEIK